MKNHLLFITGMLAVALFFSTTVSAQQQPSGEGPALSEQGQGPVAGCHPGFNPMQKKGMHFNAQKRIEHFDFLKLTDAQKTQLKDLHLQLAKEVKPLRDELRELNAHHQTLVTADDPNINTIYGSIEKIGQVKIKLAKIQANFHQKVRALLTEEQRVLFDQRHRERH